MDLPLIEEVTEEEIEEELEIFGEDVELYGNGHMASLTTAVGDGVTYLTEFDGESLSVVSTVASSKGEGSVNTLNDGLYSTEAYENLSDEFDEGTNHYGYMGYIGNATNGTQTVVLDLGAKKTFAGVRIYDSCRAKIHNNRFVKTLKMSFSDNGVTWYAAKEAVRTDFTTGYGDFTIASSDVAAANVEAQYIKFEVLNTGLEGWPQYEMEEIALLDAVVENETLVPTDFYIDYYTDASNWTWDAKEWVTSTPVTKLYDGTYYGGQGNCWHSPTKQTSLNDSPITIMFDEPKAVGGVRLYPRTDNGGATPNVISVKGTYDGTNWVDVINGATLGINWKIEAPGSVNVPFGIPGRNLTFKGIQILVDKTCDNATTGHTCFTELEVLKPVASRSTFRADEVSMEYPIGDAHVYRKKGETVTETRKGEGHIIYDGVYLTPAWFQELGGSGSGYQTYQIHNNFCIGSTEADSVYIIYDLGKVYEFSGIRLYQRVNGDQNFKEGYISVSEDGINWVDSDKITVTPTVISAITDVKFGATAYNMKTQYIKIHCTKGQSKHWAFEEVRLLQADDDKDTKTAAEIKAIYDNAISNVKTAIDKYEAYEVTLDNAAEVFEAKSLYDNILNDAQKDLVDGAKLAKLYDAATELTQTVKVNTSTLSDLGDTVHAGQLGFATVDYKLYLEDGVTITGISYDGKDITNENDEWTVGEVASDGSTTLTLGGRYYGSAQQDRLDNNVVAGIKQGIETGHYYKTTAKITGFTSGAVDITEDLFSGTLVREITMNKIGDNIITLQLSDETTKKINLVADYTWVDVPSTATLGSKDTDAITPTSSWRFATNLYVGDNVSSRGGKLFDGDYTYDNYSATYTTDIAKVDAEGTATGNVWGSANHVAISWVNGVWLDFGESISFAGVRMHMKETGNCFLYEGEVYGTNDFDGEWTLLGTATSGGTRDMTINFDENATCQYVRVVMPRYGTEKWNRLVELAILAPGNHLTSADAVAVDVATGEDAEFTFDIMEGEVIESFKNAENTDVAYTLENGTLKLANAYLNTLANGEHTFTIKFTNEQTFTLKVTKSDSSKINYLLYGNGNSNDLVLSNKTGRDVSAVTVVNGDVRADVSFIQSDDKATITVKRQLFRRATDLYSTIDIDSPGKVNVEVKFDNATVSTYEVTVDSEWVNVPSTNVTATYAQDEIAPNGWKVRISSGSDINSGPYPLIKAPLGKRDKQNWHTYFSGINGTTYGDSTSDIGHYYELDFGENPEPYNGIRHLDRAGGSTWNINVTITAKNEGDENWTEIYNAKPTYTSIGTYTDSVGTIQRYQGDMLFAEPVTYRYVRIHMRSTNSHITADNIKVIKETVRLTSAATVVGDINEAEAAKFTFYVPKGATIASVTNGDAVVDSTNYTFEEGVLTIKADYVANLGASTTLVATIGGIKFNLTIERKDIYTVTYAITSADNVRGTDDLVLVIPEGKVPTGITYGTKTVAVNPEKIPVDLVAGEKSLTIKRYVIRDLDDIFDKTEMKITVNFADETSKEYTVTLTKEGRALTGLNTEAFLEDEITPDEGAWTITASPSNGEGEHINNAFAKKTSNCNWHSAYTEVKLASGAIDAVRDANTSRLYIDVDFGTATEFGGVRYYERVNSNSGLWNGVSVYGKDASDNWVLIKSQAFDVVALKGEAAGVVDVCFTEMVKYQEVRLIIDSYSLSTAHAITFLDKIAEPEVPDKQVNIKVTPTTGGNVTVNEKPSMGDNYVAANQEVTFVAKAEVTGEDVGFMYWVEANTGKILGRETSLTVKSATGKDIKAVFADPASFEVFVSFFGRNENSVIAHSYVKKGEVPNVPSSEKLYTTGYEFAGWVTDAEKAETGEGATKVLSEVNANSSFYAHYVAKTNKYSKITVVNGKVRLATNEDEAKTEATYAYDTPVKVIADAPAEDKQFSHWEIGGEIVSYENIYRFYAPDANITVEAIFVAKDETVAKKINIAMTETLDTVKDSNGNDVKVASFLTTRYVPEGTEVLETGVIYVKDVSYGELEISEIGKTSMNGKAVKVAICDKTTSGQYKLTASYGELGIKAVGFITYVEGEEVITIYTEEIVVNPEGVTGYAFVLAVNTREPMFDNVCYTVLMMNEKGEWVEAELAEKVSFYAWNDEKGEIVKTTINTTDAEEMAEIAGASAGWFSSENIAGEDDHPIYGLFIDYALLENRIIKYSLNSAGEILSITIPSANVTEEEDFEVGELVDYDADGNVIPAEYVAARNRFRGNGKTAVAENTVIFAVDVETNDIADVTKKTEVFAVTSEIFKDGEGYLGKTFDITDDVFGCMIITNIEAAIDEDAPLFVVKNIYEDYNEEDKAYAIIEGYMNGEEVTVETIAGSDLAMELEVIGIVDSWTDSDDNLTIKEGAVIEVGKNFEGLVTDINVVYAPGEAFGMTDADYDYDDEEGVAYYAGYLIDAELDGNYTKLGDTDGKGFENAGGAIAEINVMNANIVNVDLTNDSKTEFYVEDSIEKFLDTLIYTDKDRNELDTAEMDETEVCYAFAKVVDGYAIDIVVYTVVYTQAV